MLTSRCFILLQLLMGYFKSKFIYKLGKDVSRLSLIMLTCLGTTVGSFGCFVVGHSVEVILELNEIGGLVNSVCACA